MAANLTTAAQNAVCAIVVKTQVDQKTLNDNVSGGITAGRTRGGLADAWGWAGDIGTFFSAISVGGFGASMAYVDSAVGSLASQTVTFSGNLAANDTLTLGGVTITFVTGTPSGSQVKIGASQAATMANLVTFINAGGSSNNIAGICTAAQTSTNVITLTSFYPGPIGNTISLAKVSTNLAVGGANFTGGSAASFTSPVSAGI